MPPETSTTAHLGLGFLLIVLPLAFYAIRQWALPKPIPGIPHRPGSANKILGDASDVANAVARTDVTWMQWMTQQLYVLNSPIIQVFLPFGLTIVIVGDHDETRDILVHRCPSEFDRSLSLRTIFEGPIPNHHIYEKTNEIFKYHRRLLADLMSPSFLRTVAAPTLHSNALELMQLWELKADIAGNNPFSAHQDIFEAALDAVLGFTFGKDFEPNATRPKLAVLRESDARVPTEAVTENEPIEFPEAKADEVIKATMQLAGAIQQLYDAMFVKLAWKLMSLTPKIRHAQKVRDKFILAEVQKAVKRVDGSRDHQQIKSRCGVDHMVQREKQLSEREGRDPDYYSPAMLGEVFGFVIAGHETTSTTILWGLKLLADNPRVQEMLRLTLQNSFADAKSQGLKPSATEIADADIPYLDAVLEEILRCAGSVPGVDREAVVDTELMGYLIPKGTIVLMTNQGPGMRGPALHVKGKTGLAKTQGWGSDMAVFNPDRWLSSDASGIKFQSTAGPTFPFGMGIRACFGKKLAYLELRIYIVLIIWSFHLLSCPEKLSSYAAIAGITSRPKQCFVRLSKAQ